MTAASGTGDGGEDRRCKGVVQDGHGTILIVLLRAHATCIRLNVSQLLVFGAAPKDMTKKAGKEKTPLP